MKRLVLVLSCLVAGVLGAAEEHATTSPTPDMGFAAQNACVVCHTNLPGRLGGIVHEWQQSVHFANQVTCDNCHGGDSTIQRSQCNSDEEFKQRSHLRRDSVFLNLLQTGEHFTSSVRGRGVSYFCGKCHAVIKEKHLGSPHGNMGDPTCLYCHGQGSHAIQNPEVDIIDTRSKLQGGRCATCHRAATMKTVAMIKTMLVEAADNLEAITENNTWLVEQGYKNLILQQLSDHSQESLSGLRQTFHSFNQRDINNFANAIKDNADLTKQTYEMIVALKQARSRQAAIGGSSAVFLLAFAGLLWYYRKTCLH
jgi:hypothetical protein